MLEQSVNMHVALGTTDEAWSVLVDDSDRPVVIVDIDGSIVYANNSAAHHVGQSDPAKLVGRNMQDLCGSEYAQERLACIREVAKRGEPMAIEGMTRGQFRRTIMRPMVSDEPRVLMVHVPVRKNGGSNDYEVRRAEVDDFGPLSKLTSRELEVLRLIGEGFTTAEVADKLDRSAKTVEWHRVSLGTKLGVTNRVELARIAIRAGLVDIEDALESAAIQA